MGVTTCQYLIYGAKFPYVEHSDELYDQYGCSAYDDDKEGKVIALNDGYGSEYTIIGLCIQKSDRNEPLYGVIEFNNFKKDISDDMISEINKVVMAHGLEITPDLDYGYMLVLDCG